MWMAPDIASCMYHTGIDPFTKKPVLVARNMRDRKLQRALMQFFKPASYFEVRESLPRAGRQDLIGNGCDCMIPAHPAKEAIEARRMRTNDPDHYHALANLAEGNGYRPGRKTAGRRQGKKYRGVDSFINHRER